MRRVVVTGLGVVSPFGVGTDRLWSNLVAGNSGIHTIPECSADERYALDFGARCSDFDPAAFIEPREVKKTDRFIQFSIAAAKLALADSGIELTDEIRSEFGVVIGVAVGGVHFIIDGWETLSTRGAKRVSAFTVPGSIPNMAAGYVGTLFGLEGPNLSVGSACAAGLQAVGDAFRLIQHGQAERMICGGAESLFHPLTYAGFNNIRALSRRSDAPEAASRPFDRDRDGFVLGEGAALLVLEEHDRARARGARIYAEITGYGLSGDGYDITSPHPDGRGAARCMSKALADARLRPEQVQVVNAHGTSTPANDPMESKAIETVFGPAAAKLWVTAPKSMIGHSLGAAGGLESVASVLTVAQGVVPPTRNLDNPDPECRLDYVPHTAREATIQHVLKNAFGFGGTNASVVFSKYQGT